MSEGVDWSELPEELLQMIADRLFSDIELICFRSICRKWRSSATAAGKPIPSRPLLRVSPLVVRPGIDHHDAFLSRATYFRVAVPFSSDQRVWLMKLEELESGKRRLLCPLSRLPINHSCQSLDLLTFGVSKIQETYAVNCIQKETMVSGFKRVVVVTIAGETQILGVGCDGKLRYWNGKKWTKIEKQVCAFCDIIVRGGLMYAIDINGIVWWIHSSFDLMQYSPPLFTGNDNKSFVEYREELYVVDRFIKGKVQRGQAIEDDLRRKYGVDCLHGFLNDKDGATPCDIVKECDSKTVGFKVHKLDEEWGKWIEVKSLGDRAFVLATDCCFCVTAGEFYGCLKNSIYFTDEDDDDKPGFGSNGHDLRVFKIDDGSINKIGSCCNCSHMFSPSFLRA